VRRRGRCPPSATGAIVSAMLRSILLALAFVLLGAPGAACELNARGPFDASGRPHGKWRIVHCDGTKASGAHGHGDRHGLWTTIRSPDGRTGAGTFVNDRRDGRWCYDYPDGSRMFGA